MRHKNPNKHEGTSDHGHAPQPCCCCESGIGVTQESASFARTNEVMTVRYGMYFPMGNACWRWFSRRFFEGDRKPGNHPSCHGSFSWIIPEDDMLRRLICKPLDAEQEIRTDGFSSTSACVVPCSKKRKTCPRDIPLRMARCVWDWIRESACSRHMSRTGIFPIRPDDMPRE